MSAFLYAFSSFELVLSGDFFLETSVFFTISLLYVYQLEMIVKINCK